MSLRCPRDGQVVAHGDVVAVFDSPVGLVVVIDGWYGHGRRECPCGWSAAIVSPAHAPWPVDPGRRGRNLPAAGETRVPCGTDSGYRTHHRRGEPPCAACRDAHRVAAALRRQGRPVPLAPVA